MDAAISKALATRNEFGDEATNEFVDEFGNERIIDEIRTAALIFVAFVGQRSTRRARYVWQRL